MQEFIAAWKETDTRTKQAFTELLEHLNSLEHTTLEFIARPGVSYSLRPRHASQKKRSLFAMVDVIDDDPNERWLSVCFYGEMVTDPEEVGDLVPQGLLGEDGYCFDLYAYDADEIAYLKQRLTQAHKNAAE
ncbi:MAG: hypothetical protein KKF12_16295 [Proteobacteria bacterium]|nr:hypothetical protein [Desulfobacula sp.]MBU3951694.1 hypothetical protein [Pseudomonadota bacterium]MBU4132376.1 hypothetical protein [Pseudomonadota bacterium]